MTTPVCRLGTFLWSGDFIPITPNQNRMQPHRNSIPISSNPVDSLPCPKLPIKPHATTQGNTSLVVTVKVRNHVIKKRVGGYRDSWNSGRLFLFIGLVTSCHYLCFGWHGYKPHMPSHSLSNKVNCPLSSSERRSTSSNGLSDECRNC